MQWLERSAFLLIVWCSLPGSVFQPVQQTIPSVSLCDLTLEPERYDNRLVRLRCSYIVWWESSFLYDLACDSPDCYISPEFLAPDCPAREASLQSTLRPDSKDFARRAELLVVGRFHDDNGVGYGHLGTMRFMIEVVCVEQANPIPDSVPWPSGKRAGPITQARGALHELTVNWISALTEHRLPAGREIFAKDYVLTTAVGTTLTRDQAISSLFDQETPGDVSLESVRIYGDSAVVRGRITLTSKSPNTGNREVFAYTNVFLKDRGAWKVLTTHLSRVQ